MLEHSSLAGSLSITGARAYEGRYSARATYHGGGSGYQRVWKNVPWGNGSNVWYGIALYVPDVAAYCYWNPIRWDNYRLYGGGGDVGGLAVEGGRFRVIADFYSGGGERVLFDGGAVPQGRWVWVELHQRLSNVNGQALSELYVDGRRAGSSSEANSAGRRIDTLRAGVVNVAGSCSRASVVDFDRISLSSRAVGP